MKYIEITDPVTKKPLLIRADTVEAVMHGGFEVRPARAIIACSGRPAAFVAMESYAEVKRMLGLEVSKRDEDLEREQRDKPELIVLPPSASPVSN